MKTRLIALFIITLCITGTNAQGNLTLWYKSPAKAWEEALPVGNGRMGAMIFGNPQKERIQFNENTLYSGEPETPKNINIVPDLAHIRQLLNEGKNAEAGTIMQEKWIGRLNEAYQPFGDLYIDFASKATVTDYIHSLDMENAVVTTSYKQNGVKISREVFASYPAQAIVIHLKASKPVLSFTAYLNSPHPVTNESDSQVVYLKGQAPAHAQRRDTEHMKRFNTQHLHPEYFNAAGHIIQKKHVIYGNEMDGKGTFFEACLLPSHKGGTLSISNHQVTARNNYITLYSFGTMMKMMLSGFYIYGVIRIIKEKDLFFYPLLIFIFLHSIMLIMTFFTLHDRYQWVQIPFVLLISLYGYNKLNNERRILQQLIFGIYPLLMLLFIIIYNMRIS